MIAGMTSERALETRWGMADDGSRMCDNCWTVSLDYVRPVTVDDEGRQTVQTLCSFCADRLDQLDAPRPAVSATSDAKQARSAFASAVLRMNHLRKTVGEDAPEYRAAMADRDQAKAVWQATKAS